MGEIRDLETAQIAAQASLTGHLVLSTIHTNDAVGTVGRFADMGLDRPTLAETLRGALAQRLVRRICPLCCEPVKGDLTESEAELAKEYGVPSHALEHCLILLVNLGILVETDDAESMFVPGVPFDSTTIEEVLQKIETFQPELTYVLPVIVDEQLQAIAQASAQGRTRALAGLTLKQLALGDPAASNADVATAAD